MTTRRFDVRRSPALLLCVVLAGCQSAGASVAPSTAPIPTSAPATPTPAPTAPPTAAPPTGRIAFQRSGEGNGIFTIDADGSDETQVLTGTYGTPKWSPDGTWLLVYSEEDGGVVPAVVRADGSEYRVLASPDGVTCASAIWARDGEHLAAECWVEGDDDRTGMYLGDVAGGGWVQLTKGHAVPAEFSRDGSMLLYVLDQGDASQALMLSDADGSNPRRLGTSAVAQFAGFLSDTSVYAVSGGSIVVLDLEGATLRTIRAPEPKIVEARLSPDGRWFACINDPLDTVAPGLYRIAVDGSAFDVVVHTNVKGVGEAHPDWQPDPS